MNKRIELNDTTGSDWPLKRLLLVVGLFALAWLSLGSPWLSGRVTIPYDAKAHFQAQIQFLANAIRDGQSPFWTSNVFGGSPQIADPQSMIFSPAILIALFTSTPSFQLVDGFVLGILGFGGLAILMFFKDRGWHPAAAIVAALAFAFGASAAWRIQHIGQVMSFAQFGMTLWLLSRALERTSVKYGIFAGLSAGLMVNKPDQVALIAVYFLVGYVVHHWLSGEGRKARLMASLKPLMAGAFSALLLAGIPLLMTILFAESSQRSVITYSEAVRGSLHPASLLTAFIGDLFGASDPKIEYWGPSSYAWNPAELSLSQNMGEIYFGILPAILIVTIGLVRGIVFERNIRYFTAALIVCVVYALGSYTPGFRLFYEYLPGVSGFRRPADATFIIGGLAAIVGGYVIHRWLSSSAVRPSIVRTTIKAVSVLSFFCIAGLLAFQYGHFGVAVKPMLTATALTLASIGVLTLVGRFGVAYPVTAAAALGGFMVVDLGLNNGPNESTALAPKQYEMLNTDTKNATIALIKLSCSQKRTPADRDRVELLGVGFDWPNLGMVHGFDHVLGYNPLRSKEFVEATGARDTIAGPDQRRFTPLFPSYRSTLSDMMGLRWIVSSVPVEQVDKQLRPGDLRFVTKTEDAYVYENPFALPRAMFVRDWKIVDFGKLAENGVWPEFSPRQTVLLENEPEQMEAPRTTGLADVVLKKYQNTRVEIEVNSPDPGFVILNDVWHPWWTATVDGEEVEILKANVLFRAVQVPAGKHTIVYEFKPIAGAFAEMREKLLGDDEDAAAPNVMTP